MGRAHRTPGRFGAICRAFVLAAVLVPAFAARPPDSVHVGFAQTEWPVVDFGTVALQAGDLPPGFSKNEAVSKYEEFPSGWRRLFLVFERPKTPQMLNSGVMEIRNEIRQYPDDYRAEQGLRNLRSVYPVDRGWAEVEAPAVGDASRAFRGGGGESGSLYLWIRRGNMLLKVGALGLQRFVSFDAILPLLAVTDVRAQSALGIVAAPPAAVAASAEPAPAPVQAEQPPQAPSEQSAPPQAPAAEAAPVPPAQPAPPAAPSARAALDRAIGATVVLVGYLDDGGYSVGSGALVHPNGLILTNFHLVGDPQTGQLKTDKLMAVGVTEDPNRPAPRRYSARRVVYSSKMDLLVLQVSHTTDGRAAQFPVGIAPLPLGNSDASRPGDTLFLIGYPWFGNVEFGDFRVTVTRGIHSGILDHPLVGTFIKTDAELGPGSSGGPAVNEAGELIGVNTIVRDRPGVPGQIGLTRPINAARFLIDEAVKRVATEGSVAPPVLSFVHERASHSGGAR